MVEEEEESSSAAAFLVVLELMREEFEVAGSSICTVERSRSFSELVGKVVRFRSNITLATRIRH